MKRVGTANQYSMTNMPNAMRPTYALTFFLKSTSIMLVDPATNEANRERGCDEGARIIAVVTEGASLARKYERVLFL